LGAFFAPQKTGLSEGSGRKSASRIYFWSFARGKTPHRIQAVDPSMEFALRANSRSKTAKQFCDRAPSIPCARTGQSIRNADGRPIPIIGTLITDFELITFE
jgi:hypothetical protein